MRRPLLLLVALVVAFPARAAMAHAPEPGVTAMVGSRAVAGIVWLVDDRGRRVGKMFFVAQPEGTAVGVGGVATAGWFEAAVSLDRPSAPPAFTAYRGALSTADIVVDAARTRASVRLPLGSGVADLEYAITAAAEIPMVSIEVTGGVTSDEHDHDWSAYMNSKEARHASVSGTVLGFGVQDHDFFGDPYGFIIATNQATIHSDRPRLP